MEDERPRPVHHIRLSRTLARIADANKTSNTSTPIAAAAAGNLLMWAAHVMRDGSVHTFQAP